MPITLQKSNQLKSIAILMMLCLHLFNQDYKGLFTPLVFLGQQPLSYYISLFCDACVPIFAFVSGYGLYFKYIQNKEDRKTYILGNRIRLKKLYVNYWIILILFVILGFIMNIPAYPGTISRFLLNFTALDTSYNSTWWFLTTYIFFVLSSSMWFSLLNKLNSYIYVIILLVIYCIAFYFKVYNKLVFENAVLEWLFRQSSLYFFALFQFMLGAFALKCDWHGKFGSFFGNKPFKNFLIILMFILLIILHGFVPNLIIAPFTALLFIFLFLQLNINIFFNKILDFFSTHSTNIWLVHFFIYAVFFKVFIYSFKYVIFIFFALLFICVIISYFVNFINRSIRNSLDYFKNKNP